MTGPEIVQFSAAVRKAFAENELVRLLQGLNRNFSDYVIAQSTYPDQVIRLVGAANSEGWIGKLVYTIVDARPDNQDIKDFLTAYPHWDPATNRPLGHPCDTLF